MTSTRGVLKLFDELLVEHERRGASASLHVVPVLVDELAGVALIAEAILRHAGASFLEADKLADGTVGRPEEGLVQIVRDELRLRMAGSQTVGIEVAQDGGKVRAQLEDGQMAMSAGVAVLLGIVTALFDAELRTQPLGAIAYDEAALDAEVRAAVWNLFTRRLNQPGEGLGALRTLILFIGVSDPDPPRHYGKGPSARFHLTADGRCLQRDLWDTARTSIRQLAGTDSRHFVLFLGAGFSMSSGMPLGNTLRDRALAEFFGGGGQMTSDEMAQQFHTFLAQKGRLLPQEEVMAPEAFVLGLTLERVLREVFRQVGDPAHSRALQWLRDENVQALQRPGEAVIQLQEIIRKRESLPGSRLVLVTLNFDTLIEAEYPEHLKVYATTEQFRSCDEELRRYLREGGPVPLLKLHGTLADLSSVVATVDQTARGLDSLKAGALRLLADSDRPVPWVYVGCSMRDLDLDTFLSDPWFVEHVNERWVSPFPQQSVADFVHRHRDAVWSSLNVPEYVERQIHATADAFFAELGEILGTQHE